METTREGWEEEEVGGRKGARLLLQRNWGVMGQRSPWSDSWVAEGTGLGVGSSVLLATAMISDGEANVTFQSWENGTSQPMSWLPEPWLAGTLGESLVALQCWKAWP